jgi:hypothetical protein
MQVVPGNGLEHQGSILDATHQDANVVEAPTDRNHPITADATIAGLESNDATVRRRSQGGAARLRAQRCRYHTGRYCGRRATA